MRRQLELDLSCAKTKQSKPQPFVLEQLRDTHLNRLKHWHEAFQHLIPRSCPKQDPATRSSILITQIDHANITLLLKTLFPSEEMVYNTHNPEFSYLLGLIETLISIPDPPGFAGSSLRSRAPSFEQGIILPLCFLSLKCRDLPLRKRPLELVDQVPERRAIWNRISLLRGPELKAYVKEQRRIGEGLGAKCTDIGETRERVVELGEGKVRFYLRGCGDG